MMILFFVSVLFWQYCLDQSFDTSYIFWYGGFVFLSVYALTELMDRNPYAIGWESFRCGLGIGFLFCQNDWFGASSFVNTITYILGVYFILSFMTTGWFVIKHRKEDMYLDTAASGPIYQVDK